MIEARDLFVEDDARPPFFSMEDVDIYSGKAFSSIYYLLLESLASSEAGEVKGHARHAVNQVSMHVPTCKGQLISKGHFVVFISSKKPTIFYKDFCPSL